LNWYARYHGDYMKDTSHLSLAEHGAYTVLLDHYYGTEKPLPDDHAALCRICRAFEDYERKAVQSVIDQFFPANRYGTRRNKRADIEIAKTTAISKKRSVAGVKGAANKWDSKCHSKCHSKPIANDTTSTTTTTATENSTQPEDTNTGETAAKRRGVFVIPTPQEVSEYSLSIGYQLNGEAWCDSYQQKGWMVGKTKMKDWKAAVRNWKAQGWKPSAPAAKPTRNAI
jgi:uncharacterized protein YdaU (DUF1376 family)